MITRLDQVRKSWGDGGGTRPPQFLEWGDEYLIVPSIFSYICSMKFNSTLFSVYCRHYLSLSILLSIIQIKSRSHMLIHNLVSFPIFCDVTD